ncbi:putative flagellar motor switch protein fliG [Dinoroseobacter shibae DFL 12 = DSM 16493]|jgi:flagellar motor switch protein FliG|uniref:Flagellar motor switch protein FliG n=1 Tax=Dinoroseobacter shibae (strain DSM 16493 / NCIMB 14021 / DFL 12) TaxID=398580 RepID=A8LN74_DINSH|nr:putative flagellar motor switch protein fliG [Dinoroseobacter shibae DFL 12 = DSM 16493]
MQAENRVSTATVSKPAGAGLALTRRQKAAVVLRLLLEDGLAPDLTALTAHQQATLAQEMGQLKPISRDQLQAVVAEFVSELDDLGLSFPKGLNDALEKLSGHISEDVALALRREAGLTAQRSIWDILSEMEAEAIVPLIDGESAEICAVILSKIKVGKAADVLGLLPGARARRITFAISQTSGINPMLVDQIGDSLRVRIEAAPAQAFAKDPVARLGDILNSSAAATRDELLTGLDESDEGFASKVRKAIFTFAHITDRVSAKDIPAITREVDGDVLVRALAAGAEAYPQVVEFILENMSKRMADQLRDEMAEIGTVPAREGETAMTDVVMAIRKLEADGEIALIVEEA